MNAGMCNLLPSTVAVNMDTILWEHVDNALSFERQCLMPQCLEAGITNDIITILMSVGASITGWQHEQTHGGAGRSTTTVHSRRYGIRHRQSQPQLASTDSPPRILPNSTQVKPVVVLARLRKGLNRTGPRVQADAAALMNLMNQFQCAQTKERGPVGQQTDHANMNNKGW